MKISFINKINYNYPKTTSFHSKLVTKEEMEEYIDSHPNEDLKEAAKHFGTSVAYIKARLYSPNVRKTKKPQAPIQTAPVDSFVKSRKPEIPAKETLENYILNHPEQTMQQIGEHFNASASYARKLAELYDIPHKNRATRKGADIPKEKIEEYIKAHPDANKKQIAAHFNSNAAKISILIEKYNIPYENKKHSPSISKKELENYIATHPDATQKEIAEHFDTTVGTISVLIRKYEIPYTHKSKQV